MAGSPRTRESAAGADAVLVPEEPYDSSRSPHSCAPARRSAGATRWWWSPRASSPCPHRDRKAGGRLRLRSVATGADRGPAEELTGSRHASPSWDTSSAAGRPARPTGSSVRASAWRPPTSSPPKVRSNGRHAGHGDRRRAARGGVRDASRCPTDPRRRAHAVGAVTYRLAGIEFRRLPRQPISSASVGA